VIDFAQPRWSVDYSPGPTTTTAMKSLHLLPITLLCAVRSVVADACKDAADAMDQSKFQFHLCIVSLC
jgi:hypothetical protein